MTKLIEQGARAKSSTNEYLQFGVIVRLSGSNWDLSRAENAL